MIKFISSEKFYLPIIIICTSIIVFIIVSKAIDGIIGVKSGKVIDKRKKTLFSMFKNIIKYVIAIIAVISILNVYGINTSSVIAGFGVIGVVLGLAFEDLVKDLIAGVVIIFDNHYEVGDFVKINDFMGEVISIGLKTTKIKSYAGEVKIISNSAFSEVINYSLVDYKLLLGVNVSYNQSIDKLESVLNELKNDILKLNGVNSYKLLGVDSFNDSSITYMLEIGCISMSQYAIKRECLKIIKNKFDLCGIVIPYNKLDVNIKK